MRMIFSLILFSSIFLGDFFIADAFVGLGRAKVTVNVLDGAGNPIEGAKVKIGFYYVSGQGNVVAQDGLSDAEGKFTASSKSDRDVGGNVSIDGYYTSYFSYDFKGKEFGFWQPWNPIIDVVLRKKENPVPMYARDLTRTLKKLEIPIVGQDVGFDLSKFDWVTPYGIGTTPDFIFNLERTYKIGAIGISS